MMIRSFISECIHSRCKRLLLRFSFALLLAAVAFPGSANAEKPLQPISPGNWNERTAAHLLERAGFGGTPAEVAELAALTPREAVARLVQYHRIPQDRRLDDFQVQPFVPPSPTEGQSKYERNLQVFFGRISFDNNQMKAARDWWLRRMLLSKRPLEEKLTLFWHGHLTTSNADAYMSAALIRQNKLFRQHAAGNVGELILAVSKDPAMLRYLNNNANVKGSPNENYARELLELFTLGEGNYAEKDIKEAARALTGWTFTGDGAFLFRKQAHDTGSKSFLGKTGNFDGTDVVEIVMQRPEHARFICSELFKFFVHSKPTNDQLNALVWTYRVGGNRVRPVLNQLFLSQAFYSDQVLGNRVKSPVEFLVSCWKSMELEEIPQRERLDADFAELGQELFYPPTVEGWEGGAAWITSSTLLTRYNIVGRLLLGAEVDPVPPDSCPAPGLAWVPINTSAGAGRASVDAMSWLNNDCRNASDAVDCLEKRFLRVPLASASREEIVSHLTSHQWNAVDAEHARYSDMEYLLRRATHLMLCTPEYQLH